MSILTTDNVVLTDEEFHLISDMVYKHCGITLHDGKRELVRARLSKWVRQGNFKSFKEYVNHVLQDQTGREFSTLIDSLSTNLTSFFREYQHFEFLMDKFLPALMDRKRKKQDLRIRAWSAGCSSGEEPYSIAITLSDAVAGQGRWDVKVLATDISTRVLDMAKEGVYDQQRIATVPPQQKNKYLETVLVNRAKHYRVVDNVRRLIIFRYLNLMEDWPVKGGLDFIFCRNVMIYFDKPTQGKLVNRFWNLLDPGGVLFTGHSESLTGIEHKFQYVQPTIYRKA